MNALRQYGWLLNSSRNLEGKVEDYDAKSKQVKVRTVDSRGDPTTHRIWTQFPIAQESIVGLRVCSQGKRAALTSDYAGGVAIWRILGLLILGLGFVMSLLNLFQLSTTATSLGSLLQVVKPVIAALLLMSSALDIWYFCAHDIKSIIRSDVLKRNAPLILLGLVMLVF